MALTAIFVGSTQVVVWLVKAGGRWLREGGVAQAAQVGLLGIIGLVGMAGAIFVGVYAGAWVGIGPEARQQKSFIWWVINRLLFLAAVGSIQGFALYYLRDFLGIPNAASMTTVLLGMVALFLLPAALGGGFLADRFGRKRLVALAGLIAAAGTGLLLLARGLPLVLVSGCVIGLATGIFMAVNWALGTDLAPAAQAGKYLGISNLAGAGAGIVGAGIGGPLADSFNALRPGLGYLVIFAIYGGLFLLSVVALGRVHVPVRREDRRCWLICTWIGISSNILRPGSICAGRNAAPSPRACWARAASARCSRWAKVRKRWPSNGWPCSGRTMKRSATRRCTANTCARWASALACACCPAPPCVSTTRQAAASSSTSCRSRCTRIASDIRPSTGCVRPTSTAC